MGRFSIFLVLALSMNAWSQEQETKDAELENRVTALTSAVERLQNSMQQNGGVALGGYGEMLYQNYSNKTQSGGLSNQVDQIDILRAVVYFGYRFDQNISFLSEIEFEHGATGKSGEVAVEFAHLDYRFSGSFNIRAGHVLLPMGWVNLFHEPTAFAPALRSRTENRIIPTTWHENGIGFFGDAQIVSYEAYLVNGLDATGFTKSGWRGGRQKGSKANFQDVAGVGRLDFKPTDEFLAGISIYWGDSGLDQAGIPKADTRLYDLHLRYRLDRLELRGLAALGQLRQAGDVNNANALTGSDSVGEKLWGYYLEAQYDALQWEQGKRLSPYARWEALDTQSSVPAGFSSSNETKSQFATLGLALRPHAQVVVKTDYQKEYRDSKNGVSQVNVLIGYNF